MANVPTRIWMALLSALFLASCHPAKGGDNESPDTGSPQETQASPSKPTEFQDISFRSLNQRVPVIMYHDLIKHRGPGSVWFDSTEAEFSDQMDELKSKGYHPVSLDDLYKHLTTGSDLPDKAIVLTFDDNYQGVYDFAYPILKADGFPFAVFVHTGYVGTKTKYGRAHMTWDTLSKLLKDPLFTVGSHTVTHPDLTKLGPTEVDKEMTDSKQSLETHLHTQIDYFAYPDGKNDDAVQAAAKDAGYKMAFTMENGPVEESPNILCLNRYVQTRMEKALQDADTVMTGACGVYAGPIKDAPVAYSEQEFDGKTLAMITGGKPQTLLSDTREAVIDFMHQSGAVAGINGGFFDMAAIHSEDNKMIGPCKPSDKPDAIPDSEPGLWPRTRNRPMIMWGPTSAAILPYDPPRMDQDGDLKAFMPDVTDLFLTGAWLVHDGKARTEDEITIGTSKDVQDPRRRAAFGFMDDGTVFAAAAKDSVSSSQFAEMLADAKVKEAVLLDSGFSTSLVYGEKIMASGHSTVSTPSRPVPHAIVFQGTLDPNSQKAAAAAVPATSLFPEQGEPNTNATGIDPNKPTRRRRSRRSRRHHRSDDSSSSSSGGPDVSISPGPEH